MAYDIFISYRRRGGFETAKHLYDLLTKDGYRVSFDIDTLRNGDFDTELLRRIDECRDFILILSEGALDRCVDPSAVASADWVRCELAYALEKNKNIVPIMLAGFTAFPDNLPDDIRKVVRKNGPKYDSYYFDDFYRRLKSDFLETKPEERGDEDAYVTQLLKRLSALKSVPEPNWARRIMNSAGWRRFTTVPTCSITCRRRWRSSAGSPKRSPSVTVRGSPNWNRWCGGTDGRSGSLRDCSSSSRSPSACCCRPVCSTGSSGRGRRTTIRSWQRASRCWAGSSLCSFT